MDGLGIIRTRGERVSGCVGHTSHARMKLSELVRGIVFVRRTGPGCWLLWLRSSV